MSPHKRPGLSRPRVIEAGLRLLDEVGLDALSVRRLAADLGVQSPALYWHFRTKQELLDQMADSIVQAAGMGVPRDGETWQHWLSRRARAYRASLLAHRDGARLVVLARSLSPQAIRAFDEELTALVAAGFTPVAALRTITALTHYVNGFVLQEQAEPAQTELPEQPEGRPDRLAALAQLLDGGMSATLVEALREGGSTVSEEAFEHGLRALVHGGQI